MLAVVVGTGTEVGKTFVTSSLVRAARAAGEDAIALKPVQTGTETPSDAELLGLASGYPVEPLYSFEWPESPHSAARRAGRTIELGRIRDWVAGHQRAVTLVETAGGAFTPLSARETNADLAGALRPDGLVLVCPGRVGVLHDVGATLRALTSCHPELRVRAVVVSSPDQTAARAHAAELKLCVVDRLAPAAAVLIAAPPEDRAAELALWSAVQQCFT